MLFCTVLIDALHFALEHAGCAEDPAARTYVPRPTAASISPRRRASA
jgi:hypothetical protein